MKFLICLCILVLVAFVNSHPPMNSLEGSVNLENIDADIEVQSSVNADSELIRQPRSFIRRGFCCGGGGGFRRPYGGGGGFRRPYGGGGGFGGSSSSASASASSSSFGGGFGYGK